MAFAIMALVEDGDEVIYPNPGFPIYESMIEYMGGTAVPMPLREERDFRLDAEELASMVNPRTKLIIINSPANPTGGVLTREDLRLIADTALKHDVWILVRRNLRRDTLRRQVRVRSASSRTSANGSSSSTVSPRPSR